MSLDARVVGEVPHYAYLVLKIFPPFPIEITVLCHHAETNDILLYGGRVGPSPISKMNRVELFLMETLILKIRFQLPSYILSTLYLYLEQTVSENYFES